MKRLILSTLTAAILGASAAASADNLSIGFADPLSSLDPQLNNHAGDRSVALHFWDLLIENKWNKLQPGPVSYTHLDVYKRQEHDHRGLRQAAEQPAGHCAVSACWAAPGAGAGVHSSPNTSGSENASMLA